MCQEKAIIIFSLYLQKAENLSAEPKPFIKALIEKCLVVDKNDISNLSTEPMFWMMDRHPHILLSEVNEAIMNKNPKISQTAITFLEKLLH